MSHFPLIVVASSIAAFVAAGGYSILPRDQVDPVCNIKGNISINTARHIFHVPGQQYYDSTIIRPEYGERCSARKPRLGRLVGKKLRVDVVTGYDQKVAQHVRWIG